ncbi:MAG: MFS transporter [Gemmatimonadota bacterium]
MRPGNSREIAAWASYDWANSAFTTLVVTFIYSAYFSSAFASNPERGTQLWSYGIVVSAVLIAVLSPLLGAAADQRGRRRRYLLIATIICVSFTALLAFVRPGASYSVLKALSIFVVANVAFEVAMVFYNAFLPSLTGPDRIGRVSALGWSVGYAGGLVCMLVALGGFVSDEPWFGLSAVGDFRFRATNLLVAAWFALFSLPIFIWVKEEPDSGSKLGMRAAVAAIRDTFHSIRNYRITFRFLLARLIYNDGMVTIIAFGSIYAMGTFGMSLQEVTLFGIVLNVAAGLGAFAFGFVDDRIGGRNTILISLVALAVAVTIAALAPSKLWLWVAAIIIGLFLGPNQSASRSLMGRFTPERHQSEFFGFYAFSGKATAFAGPLILGQLAVQAGQRVALTSIIGFFVIGGLLLLGVDEAAGERAAHGAAH